MLQEHVFSDDAMSHLWRPSEEANPPVTVRALVSSSSFVLCRRRCRIASSSGPERPLAATKNLIPNYKCEWSCLRVIVKVLANIVSNYWTDINHALQVNIVSIVSVIALPHLPIAHLREVFRAAFHQRLPGRLLARQNLRLGRSAH